MSGALHSLPPFSASSTALTTRSVATKSPWRYLILIGHARYLLEGRRLDLMHRRGELSCYRWLSCHCLRGRCRCLVCEVIQRSRNSRRSWRRCDHMAWHGRLSCSRRRGNGWLWRQWRLFCGDRVLRHIDMRACGIEAVCGSQQSLKLGQPYQGRRGIAGCRDEHPIRPGLRHHGVRLHSIENVLASLNRLLCLLCGRGLCQGLICRIEVLL